MVIKWQRDSGEMSVDGHLFRAVSDVRNEQNKQRLLHVAREVVYTMPAPGKPYMPRPFPKGTWNVMRPEMRTDEYKAPWFIPTDAWQWVDVWSLDSKGGYHLPTDDSVKDYGYGLHASTSPTTLGCGRVGRVGDYTEINMLVTLINAAMDRKETVKLEVA